jgi:CheY-like chemotaxis protein
MLGIGERHELPTILLIDDDLVSREVIATVLTLHGHTVHTAETGAAALELVQADSLAPEVVLMDAQLPGLSGTELIARLRALSAAKIVLISGSAPEEGLMAAAEGFLLKPFGPEDLKKLLDQSAPRDKTAIDATEPVLNAETVSQFRQLMTEAAVREIYVTVVSDLNKRIASLEGAIAAGNREEIRRIGHAIKGGCGMAGAMQVARLGAFFESKSDQLDNCADALQELYSAAKELERMLDREFPT